MATYRLAEENKKKTLFSKKKKISRYFQAFFSLFSQQTIKEGLVSCQGAMRRSNVVLLSFVTAWPSFICKKKDMTKFHFAPFPTKKMSWLDFVNTIKVRVLALDLCDLFYFPFSSHSTTTTTAQQQQQQQQPWTSA